MSAHPDRKERLKTELKRFLIMFVYLLVIIALFQFHEYMVLRQHNIPYTRFGFGLIKALVLAKVMLIGDEINLGRRLSTKPPLYTIIGRSALFAILFIAFDFLEQVVRALVTGRDIIHNISDPGGSMIGSVIVATIMLVMLIPYFAFVEMRRLFGVPNLIELLLSREPHRDPVQSPAASGGN